MAAVVIALRFDYLHGNGVGVIRRLLKNLLGSLDRLLVLLGLIELDERPEERLLFAGQLLLRHDAASKCFVVNLYSSTSVRFVMM